MSRTNIFNHSKHLLGHRSTDLYSSSLLTHFLFLFLFVGRRPNGTRLPGPGGKDGGGGVPWKTTFPCCDRCVRVRQINLHC